MRRQNQQINLTPLTYLATAHPKSGGARRDRTDDLLRARQALSQLSYGPICLPTLESKHTSNESGGSGKI